MLNINAIENNRNSDRLWLITLFTFFLLNDDPYTLIRPITNKQTGSSIKKIH